MFIAACVKKGAQPCKGGMFICVVAKTLLKITKLTRMGRAVKTKPLRFIGDSAFQ